MGTIQSESLGGSAASGGGVSGGHGVLNGFSLDESDVVSTCAENLSSGMSDAGRSESNLDVQNQQVMGQLRQESQL